MLANLDFVKIALQNKLGGVGVQCVLD